MGLPKARKPGKPESRKPGNPETRKAGNPESRKPGKPETWKAGKPETRNPGKPGKPETREAESPGSRSDGVAGKICLTERLDYDKLIFNFIQNLKGDDEEGREQEPAESWRLVRANGKRFQWSVASEPACRKRSRK